MASSAPTSFDAALDAREAVSEAWFPPQAARLARLCHAMAERFARGGRLYAVAVGETGLTDTAHVEVEFVHPVIVGKRALPALGVSPQAVALLAGADDIVMSLGDDAGLVAATVALADRGCLVTHMGADGGGEWSFTPPTDDPLIRQEVIETTYHVLWELVHVFFEHRGLLEGNTASHAHDSGASSFLYPFLADQETDLDAVLRDVEHTVVAKARETQDLRRATLAGHGDGLRAAAAAMRSSLDAGGHILVTGNGGSATDSADFVADLRSPPPGRGWTPRPAIDLAATPAVITAISNDVGVEPVFSRQVIAHGRPGDVLVVISTSGGSRNVLHALDRARRDGLPTVAFLGYDGGKVVAEGLADHVIVTPSQNIPRIQEAQATAMHILRGLIEAPPSP